MQPLLPESVRPSLHLRQRRVGERGGCPDASALDGVHPEPLVISAAFLRRASGVVLAGVAISWSIVTTRRVIELTNRETTAPFRIVPDWEDLIRGGSHIGAPAARLKIVVFSDYQCDACGALWTRARGLLREFPNDLALIVYHLPMQYHPAAFAAAVAAECAARQRGFPEFHNILFSHQRTLAKRSWVEYAARAMIPDTLQFQICLRSIEAAGRVQADAQVGRAFDPPAIPIILIEDSAYAGVSWDFDRMIRRRLRRHEVPIT